MVTVLPDPVVVPIKEKSPDWLIGLLNVIGLSIALAASFIYAELLLSAQSPYWTGGGVHDWYETAQAFGIYATLLMLAALVPYCVLAPFLMVSILRHGLSVLLPFIAALGLWFYIVTTLETVSQQIQLGFAGVLVIAAITVSLLGGIRLMEPVISATVFLFAILGGIATLYVTAGMHLLDSGRAVHVQTASLLWCAVSTLGALVICIATVKASPRWAVRMVSSLVLCGLYPAYLFVQPYIDRAIDPTKDQNVLLITVDTLRADFCSTYGGDVPTPNLDDLARTGALFNRHYSLAPWTVPSINALMTSKYPPGLTPNAPQEQRATEERSYQKLAGYWLDRDGVTFTKRLGNLGYDTAAIYANPTIEFQEWLTHGFQETMSINSINDREPVRFRQTPLLREILGKYRPEFLESRLVDSSAVVTRLGLAYMRTHRSEPFFLWLHFMDPHTPYDPPEQYRTTETPWPTFPPESATLDIDTEGQLSEIEKRGAQSLYEAEIRYVDDCVGRLLFQLRALGLDEETLVCFTSDHGEEFWGHGKWGHGYDLYDEQVRVPLIFSGKQILPNEINVPVSSIDILPTIADLMGRGSNAEWRGASLVPVLSGGDAENMRRPVFAQGTHFFRYNPEPTRMIVDRNLKLILGLETGARRLYDLSEDPGEEINLADSMPEDVERLLGMLEVWSASFPSNFDEVAGWGGGYAAETAQPDFDEVLKSLGYVQ